MDQSNTEQPRKAMTYRQLLLWLEQEAKQRGDGELDMAVMLRVEDNDGELHVGDLYSVEVDAGCAEENALLLDAAQDVENLQDVASEEDPEPIQRSRLLPTTALGWLIAILLVSMAAGSIASGIDWLDRRLCRTDGGRVERIEDSREWRCVRAEARP